MERIRPTHLHPVADLSERTLLDIVAAIELVAAGGASRVVLSNLPDPERVASEALAIAQGAGVTFRLARGSGGGAPSIIIGPAGR